MRKVHAGDVPLGTAFSFTGKTTERFALLDRRIAGPSSGYLLVYARLGRADPDDRVLLQTAAEIFIEDDGLEELRRLRRLAGIPLPTTASLDGRITYGMTPAVTMCYPEGGLDDGEAAYIAALLNAAPKLLGG